MLLFCLLWLPSVTGLTQRDEDLKVVGNPHIAPKPLSSETAGGQVCVSFIFHYTLPFLFLPLCFHRCTNRTADRVPSTICLTVYSKRLLAGCTPSHANDYFLKIYFERHRRSRLTTNAICTLFLNYIAYSHSSPARHLHIGVVGI